MVPESGIFVALKEGLWRFTFVAGDVIVSNSGDFGNAVLQVDGIEVARSQTQNRWNVETELYPTRFTMTMNSIQSLTVGQTVTVYWEGDAYPNEFPDTRFTHFTGLFLG